MKGIAQAIPTYLYVLVALVVGVMMIIMISRYSPALLPENKNISIGGSKEKISKSLVKLIEKCWEDHRRGLDDKSEVCKEITFETTLKINEKELNDYLDCEKLPNSDCYPNDCSGCTSDYFDDTDKIIWLAESENTGLEISYDGNERKIKVVGSPCDSFCMCTRDCKVNCPGSSCNPCLRIPDPTCIDCFDKCEWCENSASLSEDPTSTCDDDVDNDCDGTWDTIDKYPFNYDSDCCLDSEYPGYCDDGKDNDCDGNIDLADTDCPVCDGPAYLHGDIWPRWWNEHTCCDDFHKFLWLCERFEYSPLFNDAPSCSSEKNLYEKCVDEILENNCADSPYCSCGGGRVVPRYPSCGISGNPAALEMCDTRTFNYDDYYSSTTDRHYGLKWDGDIWTYLEIIDKDGNVLSGIASHPNFYSWTFRNDGKGYVGKNKDDYNTFACVELPTNQEITVYVQSQFLDHPCDQSPCDLSIDYAGEKRFPSARVTFEPEPGKHYIWRYPNEIEEWKDWDSRGECVGPPSDIANRLGGIRCSNAV